VSLYCRSAGSNSSCQTAADKVEACYHWRRPLYYRFLALVVRSLGGPSPWGGCWLYFLVIFTNKYSEYFPPRGCVGAVLFFSFFFLLLLCSACALQKKKRDAPPLTLEGTTATQQLPSCCQGRSQRERQPRPPLLSHQRGVRLC
jgi:hypothetical protein